MVIPRLAALWWQWKPPSIVTNEEYHELYRLHRRIGGHRAIHSGVLRFTLS